MINDSKFQACFLNYLSHGLQEAQNEQNVFACYIEYRRRFITSQGIFSFPLLPKSISSSVNLGQAYPHVTLEGAIREGAYS